MDQVIVEEDIESKIGVIEVGDIDERVSDWAISNYESVNGLLEENGALLIRGLKISGSKQLSRVLSTLFNKELLSYTYRSTPRTELRANVYTATEYHPEERIFQHNESSYSNSWPEKIGFYCQTVASRGGETPIANSAKVFNEIPSEIREKFINKGVMYVRNYQDIDLPWSEVFQTKNKSDVEKYCDKNSIQYEWLDGNGLRTRQVNKATISHPVTGESIWFNQAHLFHVSALDSAVKNGLVEIMGKDNLPRNAYFGDGSEIDEEDLTVIRDIYDRLEIKFPWKVNDLLLLDNIRYSHGRKPFNGERKVLTAMA